MRRGDVVIGLVVPKKGVDYSIIGVRWGKIVRRLSVINSLIPRRVRISDLWLGHMMQLIIPRRDGSLKHCRSLEYQVGGNVNVVPVVVGFAVFKTDVDSTTVSLRWWDRHLRRVEAGLIEEFRIKAWRTGHLRKGLENIKKRVNCEQVYMSNIFCCSGFRPSRHQVKPWSYLIVTLNNAQQCRCTQKLFGSHEKLLHVISLILVKVDDFHNRLTSRDYCDSF